MTSIRYLILGAGGAGRTAAGIVERMEAAEGVDVVATQTLAFADDRMAGQMVNGYRVIGPIASAFDRFRRPSADAPPAHVVAFGTRFMVQREQTFEQLRQAKARFFNAIDPSVVIDRTAVVGVANIIAAQCVVNPNATVGDNCFFCVATTIDHDSVVGSHVWCSPGVNLAGAVVVEDGVFLGTNATVLPGVRIGRGAVVGAGTVVRKDVPPRVTVVGNIARILREGGNA